MDLFSSLNESQKLAVKIIDKPLLVLAGAGSGKTKVITHKIAYLLTMFEPSSILALTFTNKAADEMKERVISIIGNKKGLTVSTFHSFGYKFLKEEIDKIVYDKNFVIYSEEDKEFLIKDIVSQLRLSDEIYKPSSINKLFSIVKTQFINDINKYIQDENIIKIYQKYTETMKTFNAVDLDDLVYLPVLILSKNKDIKNKWIENIEYILVDEYQDTNYIQYLLIKILSTNKNRICVVGDDDQSIYAFRGANIENILRFENDFPNAQKIVLNINYRNTTTILKAAYSLIKNNTQRHSKNIIAHNKKECKIKFYEGVNREDEVKWIAKNIFKNRLDGINYSNQVILCRTNYLVRDIETLIRKENIPYRVVGTSSFFDKKEIKDITAYLRLINNPKDNISFLRIINVPSRGIGEKTIEQLKSYLNNNSLYEIALDIDKREINPNAREIIKDFVKLIEEYRQKYENTNNLKKVTEELIEEIGYYEHLKKVYKEKETESRIKNINFFLDYMKKISTEEDNLQKFLISLMLVNSEDKTSNDNKITLMTIHSAKGLEFDCVFIPGFEEGILPHQNSIEENNIEEERRLTYVAFTRAKERLFISYSLNNDDKNNMVSRFIEEIDQDTFDGLWEDDIDSFYIQKIREKLN